MIDGATNKYIDDDDAGAAGMARRLSSRLEAREGDHSTDSLFRGLHHYLSYVFIYFIYLLQRNTQLHGSHSSGEVWMFTAIVIIENMRARGMGSELMRGR